LTYTKLFSKMEMEVPGTIEILYKTVWPWDTEGLDMEKCRLWNATHWTVGIYGAVVYILAIHILQIALRHRRKPFSLKIPLRIYNTALGIMSIYAFCMVVPDLYRVLSEPNGFHNSACRRYLTKFKQF